RARDAAGDSSPAARDESDSVFQQSIDEDLLVHKFCLPIRSRVSLSSSPIVATSAMNTLRRKPNRLLPAVFLVLFVGLSLWQIGKPSCTIVFAAAPSTHAEAAVIGQPAQFDDPYADFRNARHSNNGLLNERDEIRLGAQLHREATKHFRLTDIGLARVNRIGQRVAKAGLRPNLVYKFHVI